MTSDLYPGVTRVEPVADYLLSVTFDTGERRVLDMKPYLDFGVFKRLRTEAEFRAVRVSFDTVAWECGVDLDPEFAYAKSVAV
ncbi:MAG: DUF2442 domain-containing protein [Rhodothermales bacterium]|nr:DUF2442 domain-containing protein [Rhodothermales bacterium]